MIQKSNGFRWAEQKVYKDNPGSWKSVTRQILLPNNQSRAELRYFEVAAGGYSSFEMHEHEHCVVVVRGSGKVRLGDEVTELELHDAVHVPPKTPHQFQNPHEEPLGFLCVVDKERDRPILLDSEGRPKTSD